MKRHIAFARYLLTHRLQTLTLLSVCFFCFTQPCRAQGASAAGRILNGNWRLTLTPDPDPSAAQSQPAYPANGSVILMGLDGDKIYGEGELVLYCGEPGKGGMEAGDIFFNDQIAPDGTFTLHGFSPDKSEYSAPDFSIAGNLPAPGSTQWRGRWSTGPTHRKERGCPAMQGEVVALHLPDIKGIFSGTVHDRDGAQSEVSMEIEQGHLVSVPYGSSWWSHCVPLNAKITVKGGPGYVWGTFDKPARGTVCNRLRGDGFQLRLAAEDGGILQLDGSFKIESDLTVHNIDVILNYYPQPPLRAERQMGNIIGTLKRQ